LILVLPLPQSWSAESNFDSQRHKLICGNINLTKGSGFFLAVSGKNIVVASTVGGGGGQTLRGIFMPTGQFQTGLPPLRLLVRGTVGPIGA